ncbi:response regulator transcription factor [Membranicola marinus]|uniref:Response regulator transcription factor n=1 Tax=Membranihabitans marinus TaxID=1227546 RepID=A0A953L9T5_9BACT|nr:response regulator transcription factor [Membranihabitans marinus]MBY5957973.1 response regulator transcription factor [Membranihabitans marinus]
MQHDPRILVADDHGIVRMGLIQVIQRLKPKAILTEVNDYETLYAHIGKEKYDLAIIDVNMPNGTVQEAIEIIKIKQPKMKILIFSSQDEQLYAIRYLQMGADGFLHKLSSSEKINKALNTMLEDGKYISDEVRDAMVMSTLKKQNSSSASIESLSNRELQVANKLCEGIPLKEVSDQLNLHTSTISTYKNRVFEKLEISSIPELIELFRMYNQ